MAAKGFKPSSRKPADKVAAGRKLSPPAEIYDKERPSPRAIEMGRAALRTAALANAAGESDTVLRLPVGAPDAAGQAPDFTAVPEEDPGQVVYGGVDSTVRTPWGVVAKTSDDESVADPMEPEEPIDSPLRIRPAAPAKPSISQTSAAADSASTEMSPRALYELLMTRAADHNRSSPLRMSGTPTAGGPMSRADRPSANPEAYPAQADLVLSAIEAGRNGNQKHERRASTRQPYRVRAALRLYSDQPSAPSWTLYTRDVHGRGLGFVSRHRLPLGYGGTVELPDPDGGEACLKIPCTLLRCREAAPGWFEGSLYFNREVPRFEQPIKSNDA